MHAKENESSEPTLTIIDMVIPPALKMALEGMGYKPAHARFEVFADGRIEYKFSVVGEHETGCETPVPIGTDEYERRVTAFTFISPRVSDWLHGHGGG